MLCEAATNDVKSSWFFQEFFPKKPEISTVPQDFDYPEPAWRYQEITEEALHRVIRKMQPYKATKSGTPPNCVYKYNSDLLVPCLAVIYRAADLLGHYPQSWKTTETVVLRKPGKPDYTDLSAHRPIVLTEGHARLYNGVKTEQIVIMSEKLGLIPPNHYGGRPGRATTDAIHSVVKQVKDTWRKGLVASLLLMDVNGAFPSVAVDRLLHDLRVWGIPKAHTDWLRTRLEGRTTRLTFDGYTSDEFEIDNGLDQGDSQSVICYLLYTAELAEIPDPKKGESSVVFIDDNSILAVGKDFRTTRTMLQSMFSREGGIDQWAASHNCTCTFGLKKYQLCQLTRKREREVFQPRKTRPLHQPGLRLNGHLIKAQPVVKLLGIHIDQELQWKAQAAAALGKGQYWLMQMGRLTRVSKGISTATLSESTHIPLDSHFLTFWQKTPTRLPLDSMIWSLLSRP